MSLLSMVACRMAMTIPAPAEIISTTASTIFLLATDPGTEADRPGGQAKMQDETDTKTRGEGMSRYVTRAKNLARGSQANNLLRLSRLERMRSANPSV
jgi:hypothetical protein